MKARNIDYILNLAVAFKVSDVNLTFEGIAINCMDGIQNMVKEFEREGFKAIANRPGVYAILTRGGIRIKLLSPSTPECECWSVENEINLEKISSILDSLFNNDFCRTPEYDIIDEGYKSKFFRHKKSGQLTEIFCRL